MSILTDLRLAVRGLRRSSLIGDVAILSLALGIGANTAIFTLIDQILLRKLPVHAPEELVMLSPTGAEHGEQCRHADDSYPLYQDLQKRAEPLGEVRLPPPHRPHRSVSTSQTGARGGGEWSPATTSRCSG